MKWMAFIYFVSYIVLLSIIFYSLYQGSTTTVYPDLTKGAPDCLDAILDPDEKVVATFPSSTKDPREYLDFLKKGLAPKTS